MSTARRNVLIAGSLAVLALPALAALDGKAGFTADLLLTPGDVRTASTYLPGFDGVEWGELGLVELWAPIDDGKHDGLAADGDGSVYVLIRGRDSNSGTDPEYTGLVRVDGTGVETVVQDRMSSGLTASRLGAELRAVCVSPSSTGRLTTAHPVLIRHTVRDVAGVRVYAAEVVSLDPSSGSESVIGTFGAEASHAHAAIDGSGGTRDGVVYVGPLQDGRIAALTWNGSNYAKTYVPGTFRAATGLLCGPDGLLYTFPAGETWSGATGATKDVYRLHPTTGTASYFASVPGWTFPQDWEFARDGRLWIALQKSGRKPLRYVAEMVAGATVSTRDRISESDDLPWSLATGADGKVFVLEDPFDTANGEVWSLTPGSGGGSGSGGGGRGKKK